MVVGSVVEGAVVVGSVVVWGADLVVITVVSVAGGGAPATVVGSVRTEPSSVLVVRPGFRVVLWRAVAPVLDDGGTGGSRGWKVLAVGPAGEELDGLAERFGKAVVCRLLNATAAVVANPVAIAIPAAAHTTSRCGRASGSS